MPPSPKYLVDALIYDKNQPSDASSLFPELMPPQGILHENEFFLKGDESISRCNYLPLDLNSFNLTRISPGSGNLCKADDTLPPVMQTPSQNCVLGKLIPLFFLPNNACVFYVLISA